MKKIVLCMGILCVLLTFTTVNAQGVQIMIDGEIINIDSEIASTFIDENNVIQVPLKPFMNVFAHSYQFNSDSKTITVIKEDLKLVIPVGESYYIKNDIKINQSLDAKMINGTIYIPIKKAIAPFGGAIEKNTDNNIINIISVVQKVNVHFINIGNSDATLIEYGKSHVLIDAGDEEHSTQLVQYLKEQDVDDIELFVATNSKDNHIGGADKIFNNFNINYIFDCKWLSDSEQFKEYIGTQLNKSTKEQVGYNYNINDITLALNKDGTCLKEATEDDNISIRVIGNNDLENINKSSNVVLLNVFGNKVLIMSDVPKEIEQKYVDVFGECKILKVGNNGKSISTSELLLNGINPDYAIISCKENESNSITETANKLKSKNIEVYRTDEKGNIKISIDQLKIDFNKYKNYNIKLTVNPIEDVVTIHNNSNKDIDISNWKLVNKSSGKELIFSQGNIIKAQSSTTVASGFAMGDIQWSSEEIWANGDEATLYDSDANIVIE